MLRTKSDVNPQSEDIAMLKPRLLSAIAQVVLFGFLLGLSPFATELLGATCTGADPCHACKNCKYCRHCAKEGGKCGVCK